MMPPYAMNQRVLLPWGLVFAVVFGTAAYGNCAGAAGTGIRTRFNHHRPQRSLSGFKTDGSEVHIENPAFWPPTTQIQRIMEPYVKATIMVPSEYVGVIMELSQEKRGSS